MEIKKVMIILILFSGLGGIPLRLLSQTGIEITSGGTITATGAATILITDGSLINNGTWTKDLETVTMTGTVAKVISGSSSTSLNNLSITNTGGITTQVPLLTTNDLTVGAGSQLTIDPVKKLTVNGTLVNSAGNTGIMLRSTSAGSASLLHSTANVTGTAERYVAAWDITGGHGGYHFLSSPMVTESIRPFFVPVSNTPGSIHQDFYKWDESSSLWINTLNSDGSWNTGFESEFVPGRGYMVAYDANVTRNFRDSLNVAPVTLTGLTNTAGQPYKGWHLVGNPFACAILWGQGDWVKTNIGTYAQIWNNAAQSYKVLRGAGEIPPMNGFMVYTSGSGELTIPANARMHSDSAWYKSQEEEMILLTATGNEHGGYQETLLRFTENGKSGFDMNEDCQFMAGFAPRFYSVAGSSNLALNTLPAWTSQTAIPLGFVKNEGENFTIALVQTLPGVTVYLSDLLTGSEVNLSQQSSYTFTSNAGDDPNRFVLHFGHTGVQENSVAESVSVYTTGRMLHVNATTGNGFEAQICVFDLMGRSVYTEHSMEPLPRNIALNGPAGYYIVKVINKAHTITRKVLVH